MSTGWIAWLAEYTPTKTAVTDFLTKFDLSSVTLDQITDWKVIAKTLGISFGVYLYIKYKGTKEQNEVLQKELNRRRRESEYSSLARRHRRSSSDFDSDSDRESERHKRHASRRSRDSSTPVKKRKGGTVRRRKSNKKR